MMRVHTWLAAVGFTLAASAVVPISTASAADGEALAKGSDCMSCHAVDHKVVGPAFQDVAKRYASQQPGIIPTLVKKVKTGGSGNWGDVPMSPHPQLSDADLTSIVTWVLSTGSAKTGDATAAGAGKKFTYTNADGKQVTTDFQVYTDAKGPTVTADVFNGYEQYNSYCFRCHGGDAEGSEYAPNLRDSVTTGGMSWQAFLSTAMTGRQDKGMPSWAGFFSETDLHHIYEYVDGRALGLVPTGRPTTAN